MTEEKLFDANNNRSRKRDMERILKFLEEKTRTIELKEHVGDCLNDEKVQIWDSPTVGLFLKSLKETATSEIKRLDEEFEKY